MASNFTRHAWAVFAALGLTLAGCGGGGGSAGSTPSAAVSPTSASTSKTFPPGVSNGGGQGAATAPQPTTQIDAARLAQQASFGSTESLIAQIQQDGARKWVLDQFDAPYSIYTSGWSDAINTWPDKSVDFCEGSFPNAASPEHRNCWRDWYSGIPLVWDFYRQAVAEQDQLRQRVAFALGQIVVVSDHEVSGTYGLRRYHQTLRNNAFGNYRDVLRSVLKSPVMGEYLNGVNNDKSDPNENLGRELLQLFSIGTCELNGDGSLKGGVCQATYDNAMVRNYAYALTGWTFAPGGIDAWCGGSCGWKNAEYLGADMIGVPAHHDQTARDLLSGVKLPASRTPDQAIEAVLDSVMNHPNIAPFIGRQFIRHFTTSNPSPGYVRAVADAFASGTFDGIGSGIRGDLRATIAAVLLHDEARNPATIDRTDYGRLREPALMFAASIRALEGSTDGDAFGYWWGESFNQRVFSAPSVFNFYAADAPLPGSTLVAPQFGLENPNTSIKRMNYAWLLSQPWLPNTGVAFAPNIEVPKATGTIVNHAKWAPIADDAPALIDRFDLLFTSKQLTPAQRQIVIDAVNAWNDVAQVDRPVQRVRIAAYLMLSSPQFAVIR